MATACAWEVTRGPGFPSGRRVVVWVQEENEEEGIQQQQHGAGHDTEKGGPPKLEIPNP